MNKGELWMRIAVLMSTYNGEDYLHEQINSILLQNGNFQLDLWVRDDGSKDNTHSILQKYAEDNKLTWYTGKNLGPMHSFMDLIHHCKGYDYYAFSDQDDYWLPDKLLRGISFLSNRRGPTLYFSNAQVVDRALNDLDRKVYKKRPKLDFYTLTCAGGLLGCTMVFNKKLAEKIQEKAMPSKIVMHDFYLSLVCLAIGGIILYDELPSVKYRQHGKNVVGVSHGFSDKVKARLKSVVDKPSISISDQAKCLLELYISDMNRDQIEWLNSVSNYRKSTKLRIRMACSLKVRYINLNMGLKNRIAILLGNR